MLLIKAIKLIHIKIIMLTVVKRIICNILINHCNKNLLLNNIFPLVFVITSTQAYLRIQFFFQLYYEEMAHYADSAIYGSPLCKISSARLTRQSYKHISRQAAFSV